MTVLSNIITPSNVLTTTNTATVTNKTLTSPTVTGMTVSDGTANGVTYLNGSKVLTSGSALTFDGNTLTAVNTSGNAIVASRGSKDLRLSGNYAGANTHAVISTTTGMALAFMDESAEYMRLTSTGLGIGTSSPAYKLDVNGTIAVPNLFDNSGSVRFKYSAVNAASRDWRIVSDIANYGDFGIQQSTTQGGSTFDTKLIFSSAGNLGLGVTPSAWNSIYKVIQTDVGSMHSSSTYNNVAVGTNFFYNASNSPRYIRSDFATQHYQYQGQHQFFTAPSGTAGNVISFTQAMTLDASGNLLVATTNTSPHSSGTYGIALRQSLGVLIGVNDSHAIIAARWNGNGEVIRLQRDNTDVGSIDVTTTATSYNTSSDYRLKENIAPMTGALTTVAQLKPVTYTWKVNGTSSQGFIAHELQAVVPDCVTGEKDAVDAEGNPKYQGIDTSFLVATLTAALQELNAKFEAYVASHP